MTLSDSITANWDQLSESAKNHIIARRPQLLQRWELWQDDYSYAVVGPEDGLNDIEAALQEAIHNVERRDYPDAEGTLWVEVSARNVYTGEISSHTVTLEPDEPECIDRYTEHDWQSPHDVVGGLSENPGVHGHGGGVISTEVCAHCGAYRVTDTWAQRPDTGEQGLTSVEYREPDAESRAWIESRESENANDE